MVFYEDPFVEANAEESGVGLGMKDYVHMRI